MICVFTGGRNYKNRQKVKEVIDALKPAKIYVGDCPSGADRFVQEYCMHEGIRHEIFKADWDKFGRSAGPIRNKMMLDTAPKEAILVAFDGGAGTRGCMKLAMEASRIVFYVSEIFER